MWDNGYTAAQISESLLIDEDTISNWRKRVEQGGLNGLLSDNFSGGLAYLTQEDQRKLANYLEANLYTRAVDILQYIKEEYHVEYSANGLRNLLHRLGFTYKKPKHVPGKADAAKQAEFLENLEKLSKRKKPEDRIYYVDGVHPIHNSQPSYGWIKKGTEKELKANAGRDRININGAYRLEDQKVIIKESPVIDSQSTIHLFNKIRKSQRKGIIYVVLDNARYYRSRLIQEYLKKNRRIKLLFLPPYSPNLNLIERLWRFFRSKIIYNKYYEKFSVFREIVFEFFENITKYKKELKSLLNPKFQLIGTHKLLKTYKFSA